MKKVYSLDQLNKEVRSNVREYGAIGDGVTANNDAFIAMATDLGYISVRDGDYALNTMTIDVPIYFEVGANITSLAGQTVTFNNPINATREYIFQGIGDYLLNEESSHFAYPEWFGAFANKPTVDAGVLLQKLSGSVVAGRECRIEFGDGTWYVYTSVAWSRACHIQGSGDRITHFRCQTALTGDVFTTADEGVQFRDIQFSNVTTRASGTYLGLYHNYCKADRIWFTDGFEGITTTGDLCEVDTVQGFNWSTAANGYMVKTSGNGCKIKNVTSTATTAAPKYVVLLDVSTNTIIYNISGSGANTETVVGIVPTSGTIQNVSISNVFGSDTKRAVQLLSGTHGIYDVSISKVFAQSCASHGVDLDKTGSGILKYVTLDQINAELCVNGVRAYSTSATIQHLLISNSITRACTGDGITVDETQYVNINNCQSISNTLNGIAVELGCDNFIVTSNQSLFNGTAFTDNSGAVTKVIKNNIGIIDV